MKTWNRVLALVMVCALAMTTLCVAFADSEPELTTLRIMGKQGTSTVNGKQITLEEWLQSDSKIVAAFNELLASYGLKLEFDLIPDDQYQVVCQTRLATGFDCDMINITPLETKTRMQLAEQGRILPINQIVEEYSDGTALEYFKNGRGSLELKVRTLEDGNLYWMSGVTRGDFNGKDRGSFMAFMLRQDWVDALGAEMPTTTDELYDILVRFQEEDVNQSGVKDEVISVNLQNFNNGIAQWFGLGMELAYIDTDGVTIKTPWYCENVKEYFAFMQKLVAAGLVDTSNQADQKRVENKLGGEFGWGPENWLEPSAVVPEGAKTSQLVPLLCNAVEGTDPSYVIQGGLSLAGNDFAITSECKNLEAMGRLLDCIYSDEYFLLSEYGIEGYTYEVAEDGTLVKLNGDDLDQKIMYALYGLWELSALPRNQLKNRAVEVKTFCDAGKQYGYEDGWVEKYNACVSFMNNDNNIVMAPKNLVAIETEEEMERSSEILTDLTTYSEELATKLILGEKSLDDWDTYMADLERLGLNEYVAIFQARLDRANANVQ